MPQEKENNIVFTPNLNPLRLIQRRLKIILGWLVLLFLILFGIYGIFILFVFPESSGIFYSSLLTDMFILYLWQRKGEKVKKINPFESGKEIEVSLFLNKSAQKSLEKAWLIGYQKGYNFLRPIHLFACFLKERNFGKILKRLDCQSKLVADKTKRILSSPSFFSKSDKKRNILGPKITADFKEIFYKAYLLCLENNKEQIGSLDILWAISQQKNLVGMIFDEFGVSPEEVERVIQWGQIEERIKQQEKAFFWKRLFKPKGKLNRAMTAALTPLLDRVSQDMTFLARQGAFEIIINRNKEIEKIFNFFSAGQSGVILVGESEIGKKAILKKIAQLMVSENVPGFLQDKKLISLDLSSFVSLAQSQQKGEEYLKKILFEVNRAGNIILVIENVDNLVGLKSQESGLDFAEILASSLENKAFYFISTTSLKSFSSKIEGQILGRLLNEVKVVLPPIDLIWQILITKIFIIERELKVFFSADALEQAVNLADQYLYGKALPAKAMDLLAEVASLIRSQRGANSIIKGSDIIELVSKKTEIPLGQIQETEKERLLQMEELIHHRVIDQEEGIKAIASALRRSRLELQNKEKTICNFLFIGPTGVGKTESAKALARVYFGNEKRMIRLDMSEYQEKRGLRRLIGMHSDQGITKGYLTEAVKRQPYSLLLLDEIEKAHPDVLNLFLQVMDDGRLTDVSGEVINFTNIILIATSNAGTQFIQEEIRREVEYKEIEQKLKDKVLLEHFRPEFLNRFDKIVLFKALSMENMVEITRLFLKVIKDKLEEKGVKFEIEYDAVEELAQLGYDPLYGARPLKRVIQDRIENSLAKLFLEDKINRRDKLILKKGLVFEIEKAPMI